MKRTFNQCTSKHLRQGLEGNLSFSPFFFTKKREVTVNDRLSAASRINAALE